MVLSSHNQNEDTKMFSVRVYPFCKEQDLFSFDPKARQLQKKKLKIKNLQLREGELAFTMLNKLVTQQLSKKKKMTIVFTIRQGKWEQRLQWPPHVPECL